MSYDARIIEVFLSSPGNDVDPERDLVAAFAAEWNRLRGRETGCFISILGWEELVAPALGSRAQEVINEQIGDTYDVYLSLMWTRAGTPTGEAESGTIEEFENALERARRGDELRIAALFKNSAPSLGAIDAEQLQKVQEFKRRISNEGGLYREFEDDHSLRSILNVLFEQIAKDKDTYALSNKKARSGVALPSSAGGQNDSEKVEETEPDEQGLIEVGEEFSEKVAFLLDRMSNISRGESDNTDVISDCNDALSAMTKYGSIDPSKAKTLIKKASDSMLRLADIYDQESDDIGNALSDMSSLVEQDIQIRLEFDNPMEVASSNITSIKELQETVEQAVVQLDELIDSTRRLPRMSSGIAKAKSRLVKNREKLRSMLNEFGNSLRQTVSSFEKSVAE